jgi:hypothetical protein
MSRRAPEVAEPRSNVVPLRRRDGSGPSLQPRLYDVEREPAGPEPVILAPAEAQLIASLLKSLRHHAPSPRGIDAAIATLMNGGRGTAS